MQRTKRRGLACLLITMLLFMSVPMPLHAAAGDASPIVIDNIVDSIDDTWVMSVIGLSDGNTGIVYSTSDDNWITLKARYKVLSTTGALLSDTDISALMGARATNVYLFTGYAIANGNAVITWEGTNTGCGGAFQFVIVGSDGTIVKQATDISTAVSTYNCYTNAAELSNGNLVFMWQDKGDEYLYRIFDPAGNVITNPASIEKNGTRQDNFPHNSTYSHSISANDQGQFLISYDIYQNSNYIGAMYNNDGSGRQVNGFNHFYLAPKPSSARSYNIPLTAGDFGVFFSSNSSLSMNIIDNQGAIQKQISSGLMYSDNAGGAFALKGGEFLVYDTQTSSEGLSYLHTKRFRSDGTMLQDWTQRDSAPVIDKNLGYYYSFSPFIFPGYDSGFGFYNTVTNKLYLYDMDSGTPPETPAAIVGQPSNAVVNAGANASFAVTATNATAYQWQVNTGSGYENIADGGVYSGATTDTLSITGASLSMNGYQYRVIVSGAASSSVISNGAGLTVNPLINAAMPTISAQPVGQSVEVNGVATLTISAAISDSGSLSYQWYSSSSNNNSGGAVITGANGPSYTAPTGTPGTTYYYAEVTNTNNSASGAKTATAVSDAASVTVSTPATFTVSETGTVVLDSLTEGYTAAQINAIEKEITLTKAGSGAISNLAVRFGGGAGSSFRSSAVSPDALGAGVSSAVFRIFPKTGLSAGTYAETVTITADGGLSESFDASFTVVPLVNAAAPDITAQPISRTTDQGAPVTLHVEAAVSDGGTLHYEWYSNSTNSTSDGAPIADANSDSYTVPTETAGTMYYYVVVTNVNNSVNGSTTAKAISDAAEITVNPLVNAAVPAISAQPADQTVDEGTAAVLSVTATAGDSGTLSYQWYSNTTNSTSGGTLIADAESAAYTVPAETAGTTYYYVVVTNTNNSVNGAKTASATSSVAEVIVNPTYKIEAVPDQTAAELVQGYAASESKTITITNNGSGKLDNLKVALSGSDAEHFAVTAPDASLNPGASTSFSLQAKQGLAAAVYSVTVTISATHMTDESFTFTQAVVLPDPPSKPQQVSAIRGNGQVKLAWKAVAGADYYNVYRAEDDGPYTLIGTVTAHEYAAGHLVNGTRYSFVVRAGNAGGLSAESDQVQAVPAAVPGAPANVAAVAGDRQATVAFTAPSHNGGSEITGYKVIAAPGNLTATGSSSPITVTGLTNGVSYSFTVQAINEVGASSASAASNLVVPKAASTGDYWSYTPYEPMEQRVEVKVNGEAEMAGIVKRTMADGQSVTTITVDEDPMMKRLEAGGEQAVITIPFLSDSDRAIGEINGHLMNALRDRNAAVVIRTNQAAFTLPAREMDIEALSERLAAGKDLKNVKLQIEIAAPSKADMERAERAADVNGVTIVVPPLKFSIYAIYGTRSVETENFASYVERMIEIPSGADPAKMTTGAAIEPDGSIRHVPTKVEQADGRYYAHINSLTNGMYAVIWNTARYKDAAAHWASKSIHNMGERLIVNGASAERFEPDREITRAEFTAIIVRALGLKLQAAEAKEVFSDVKQGAWYSSAVQTARDFGLITGLTDGAFHPQENITRQQAMLIIAKAMKITGLPGAASGSGASVVGAYKDGRQVAGWAVAGVADAVSAGIVSGRGDRSLAPQAVITRAETAVMAERLLQNSGLINGDFAEKKSEHSE